MAKYRKKPVVIEAEQWFTNKGVEGVIDHALDTREPNTGCQHCGTFMDVHGWISTLEGGHIVCPGDWIITGVKGEHYPCKPDIFEMTYELEV